MLNHVKKYLFNAWHYYLIVLSIKNLKALKCSYSSGLRSTYRRPRLSAPLPTVSWRGSTGIRTFHPSSQPTTKVERSLVPKRPICRQQPMSNCYNGYMVNNNNIESGPLFGFKIQNKTNLLNDEPMYLCFWNNFYLLFLFV